MEIIEFNPDFFSQQLEHTLLELKQEIAKLVSSSPVTGNVENWDNYLLTINSFYYQSFHQRVFPQYKEAVQKEVTQLLRIRHQEDMVKKDIMANIKRYVKLYNLVKNLMDFLEQCREKTSIPLLNLGLEEDYRFAQLLHLLKNMQKDFIKVSELSKNILNQVDDQEFKTLLKHPAATSTWDFITSIDKNNANVNDALAHLLAYLTYLEKIISRLPNRTDKNENLAQEIISEISNRCPDSLPVNEVEAIKRFYETQIKPIISLYLSQLKLNLIVKDFSSFNHSLNKLEEWLTGLKKLIEKSRYSYYPVSVGHITLIANLNPEIFQRLSDVTQNIANDLNTITSELSSSSQPDWAYFFEQTQKTLKPAHPLLKEALEQEEVFCFPELNIALNQLELQLSLLSARIDLLNREHELNNHAHKKFLSIVNLLNTYLNILANSKSDLERILAPHNITRIWKYTDIRITRIPLQKGKTFPSEYLYLLDKHQVETRIATSEEEDNLIVQAEGDVFIIRVDDLLEEEMPYMVVAQKG